MSTTRRFRLSSPSIPSVDDLAHMHGLPGRSATKADALALAARLGLSDAVVHYDHARGTRVVATVSA
ncbi:MAG: hypothetical protein Q8S73_24515 [Deltaproteobacteria bacterium]|nr:hypothetical protein [Myxococcales bacterium]MDP3217298.1 hypothetical protein [Deltaproteobacteria bacterium]